MQEWLVHGFSEFIKTQSQKFLTATEDPADGVTLRFTIENPQGFKELGQALVEKGTCRQHGCRNDRQRPASQMFASKFSRGIAVIDQTQAIHEQTERQVAHWTLAAHRLNLDDLASPEAWGHLERYLGVSLRSHLTGVIDRLQGQADVLTAMQRAAQSPTAAAEVRRKLLAFRQQYLRTETTLDFFADAINGRTNARVAALLRACDTLAYRSMSQLLDQIGKTTPSP